MSKLWKNFATNFRRERFLGISNILVMTITFVILGGLLTIVALTQTAIRSLEKQAQITIFFKDDFGEPQIAALQKELSADPRILEISYVSKEDALKIFKEINKDEPILLESVSASILPASLEIKALDIKDLNVLYEEFLLIDGAEEVKFFREVLERFRFWSNVVYIIGFALVGVFIVVSYSTILVTLRSTINSKGVELEILKLVGATDKYVKQPLVFQGVVFGLISAILSSSLLLVVFALLQSIQFFSVFSFGFLPGVYMGIWTFALLLCVLLTISGVLLGYLGSAVAVRKYLKY